MEKSGWVYIMTNKTDGTLYVGVTSNLVQRIHQHRKGTVDNFTKRYNLNRLVYAEPHVYIERAIQREHRIKKWPRGWKVNLIASQNPEWRDLYDRIV